ncbi:hypothetical protein EBZ80_12255 [bacterium]|nr:hypothetical protein [bacterium]
MTWPWFVCAFTTSLPLLRQVGAALPDCGLVRAAGAYGIQVFHDYITIMLLVMVVQCQVHVTKRTSVTLADIGAVALLNAAHGVVMTSFAYHKRCILTIWYNTLLQIDPCNRYVPIWQRAADVFLQPASSCASSMGIIHTNVWLNNHILFATAVICVNMTLWWRIHGLSSGVSLVRPAPDRRTTM